MIICMKLGFKLWQLLLATGLAILFASLSIVVLSRPSLAIDQTILTWIGDHTSGAADTVAKAITLLGEWPVVMGFGAVLAVVLYRNRQRKLAIMTISSLFGSVAVIMILKHDLGRARPELWEHLIRESSFSFPSGHAVASMALAITLLYVMWHSRWRVILSIIMAAYVLFVGFTRLYLGVHYPSDILGGWLAAAAWVLLVISIHSGSKRYTV